MGEEIKGSILLLTWLVFDVVLGATFGRYFTHINFLIEDLHLREGRHHTESSYRRFLLTKAMCLYLRRPLSYTRCIYIEDETQQDTMGLLGASSLTLINLNLDEGAFWIIKMVNDAAIMKKE